MKRRSYEPLGKRSYQILVDGVVVYATTNPRRFNREARKYLATANATFAGPR